MSSRYNGGTKLWAYVGHQLAGDTRTLAVMIDVGPDAVVIVDATPEDLLFLAANLTRIANEWKTEPPTPFEEIGHAR